VTLITRLAVFSPEPALNVPDAYADIWRPALLRVPIFGELDSQRPPNGSPMVELTLNLEFLAPVDWRVLRAARLEALLDSPHSFVSSYAHESVWGEQEWLPLFDAARWIVAREDERVIGLVRSVGEPESPSARHLESIWVAPTHRRRGVLRHLLLALAQMERRMGVTHLLLWVLEDNDEAQLAYEALGFKPTGERQFLPAAGRFEQRLTLYLRPSMES
jgi:ribosomal protein S18 acetylase RimI-like enzyme